MIPLCKTTDMETSIRLLGRNFDRVLVNGIYKLTNPIRVRPKLLEDGLLIGRNADRGAVEVRAWENNGGVLLNYRRDVRFAHDIQVFAECPMSFGELLDDTVHTKVCAVVYRPPSWEHHASELHRYHPRSRDCRAFVKLLEGTGLTNDQHGMLTALGLPTTDVSALTESEFRMSVGMREAVLRGEHDRAYCQVTPIITRVAPSDRALSELYRAIDTLQHANGVRLALDSTLYQASKKWRVQLKALARCGSVTVQPRIGFYVLSKIKPDYERIQREHDNAVHELERIIQVVDNAPILTPEKVKRLQQAGRFLQFRQASAAPRESSSTPPDTQG